MKTYLRKDFRVTSFIHFMHMAVEKHYVVPADVEETLLANKDTIDFCVECSTFALIETLPGPVFIGIDVSHWIKDDRILIKFDSITIYDSFEEYEPTRRNALGISPIDLRCLECFMPLDKHTVSRVNAGHCLTCYPTPQHEKV